MWQHGSEPSERFRISRPERGLLLIDLQLQTGQRASGVLRRPRQGTVLHADLTASDGGPAGVFRLRTLDATSAAFSTRPADAKKWLPEINVQKATVWCYTPPERRPIGIREVPEHDGPRTKQVLKPGDVFCVSAERRGTGDVIWLKLADGRGWAFDRQPGSAALCTRHEVPIAGFTTHDGYMHPGGEIHAERMTLEEAKVRCAALPDCCGFCYEGSARPLGAVDVIFKSRWQHGGRGEGTGWTSCRVEWDAQEGREVPEVTEAAMTPAEVEDAQRWYEEVSKGWITRHKAEGANAGGLNALEDIIRSMDRCDVAEDPEVQAVRSGLEALRGSGCTALTPLTPEGVALVPTGKLTSSLRPYSAKEGDDETEPNAAVHRLTGPAWVRDFRKHHPAARVSPGLTLRMVTGNDTPVQSDDEFQELTGGAAASSSHWRDEVKEPEESRGMEEPWWEDREVEVTGEPSLEDRAALIGPVRPKPKPKATGRSRMAMPKARPLIASAPAQPRSRQSGSGELGDGLLGLLGQW